jgi:hypothetical protein
MIYPGHHTIATVLQQQRPVKQPHTARRLFERLREEHGFTSSYTIVKDYVRSSESDSREFLGFVMESP